MVNQSVGGAQALAQIQIHPTIFTIYVESYFFNRNVYGIFYGQHGGTWMKWFSAVIYHSHIKSTACLLNFNNDIAGLRWGRAMCVWKCGE